jgi:hypothetical protein
MTSSENETRTWAFELWAAEGRHAIATRARSARNKAEIVFKTLVGMGGFRVI